MTTNNNTTAMPATPPHRGGGWEGVFFKLSEFTYSATATARHIENVPSAEAMRNLELLTKNVLDPLREAWGGPIIINSGYRSEELNKAVGGAQYSYHMLGMAADIRPQNGLVYKLYDLVVHLFHTGQLGLTECYVDRKRGYIHIAYDASGFNVWPFISN